MERAYANGIFHASIEFMNTSSPREALVAVTRADVRSGVWAASQLARVLLPYVPARNKLPIETLHVAEDWVSGTASSSEAKAAARTALKAADKMTLSYASVEGFSLETYALGAALNVVEMAADPAFAWNAARGVADNVVECMLEVLVRNELPSKIQAQLKRVNESLVRLIAHAAEHTPARKNPSYRARKGTRKNPVRYPGDQDPSNLGFAQSRDFIERAIKNLQPANRKAVEDLINNPLVDAVRTKIDEEDTGQFVFVSIVIRSGLWQFSWLAFIRDYRRARFVEQRDDRFFVSKFRYESMAQYRTAAEAKDAFLANIMKG